MPQRHFWSHLKFWAHWTCNAAIESLCFCLIRWPATHQVAHMHTVVMQWPITVKSTQKHIWSRNSVTMMQPTAGSITNTYTTSHMGAAFFALAYLFTAATIANAGVLCSELRTDLEIELHWIKQLSKFHNFYKISFFIFNFYFAFEYSRLLDEDSSPRPYQRSNILIALSELAWSRAGPGSIGNELAM